ncbi:protein FAM177B [Elgaria multicarinata webbii]|uniref:protein FAM177B n=1 Tax=Elgaria multicarinata webbii TaxID=159646 RepID=UPI002FCCD95E
MEDSREILKEEENSDKQLKDQKKEENRTPRRIIYFANGESMEEYSTEEEDPEENNHEPLLDMANISWGSFLRVWVLRIAMSTFFTCEFLGGKLATFFGLNEPKYQYAIDEYYRTQKEGSESDEDGEEMQDVEGAAAPNETQHLEMQGIRYGSTDCEDMAVLPQENTVANVNEVGEGSLLGP